MGYYPSGDWYAAGDPGIFDFIGNAARSIFNTGAKVISTAGQTWRAAPGELGFSKILGAAAPFASFIPGIGSAVGFGLSTASSLAESYGSATGYTAPSEGPAYNDMQTFVRQPRPTSYGYSAQAAMRPREIPYITRPELYELEEETEPYDIEEALY